MRKNATNETITTETDYEKLQKFNALVSWLHSYRYKNILRVFEKLSQSNRESAISVVEIGCAHAKLYALLRDKFKINYIGIETDADFVKAAVERHGDEPGFTIINDKAEQQLNKIVKADIIVALETLEHIPEHNVVRIIEEIARLQPKLFICSVPVEVGPAIWFKNIGSFLAGYMRHTEYTWKETFWAGLGKLDKLPPHGIRHKGFDWRWLAQTIRHNMKIIEIKKFPFNLLPAWLSTSVFMIAEPRVSDKTQSET